MNKILYVTFPVDLGSRTIESSLISIFEKKMSFYRFAERHVVAMDEGKISFIRSVMYRLVATRSLRIAIKKAVKSNQFVVFHCISPALFSFGIWKKKKSAIVIDWTWTIRDQVEGKPIKKNLLFYIQRHILRNCECLLCYTDALRNNLIHVYGIKPEFIQKVSDPLLVEEMNIAPRPTPSLPRVLFVGGDFLRKGGDVILNSWKEKLEGKCELSLMTNYYFKKEAGIQHIKNVKFGTPEHLRVFHEHDILLLPTRFDVYPQVIGEAAAAGLAVITTKFALGAPDVIENNRTGFICDSPEQCIEKLLYLISKRSLLNQFKQLGYEKVHENFSKLKIREEYLTILESKNKI